MKTNTMNVYLVTIIGSVIIVIAAIIGVTTMHNAKVRVPKTIELGDGKTVVCIWKDADNTIPIREEWVCSE